MSEWQLKHDSPPYLFPSSLVIFDNLFNLWMEEQTDHPITGGGERVDFT